MPRKFAFELSHLKISSQKPDVKSPKNDPQMRPSTPPPQSVRPLSPKTTAELRSACAYVVQNYKPSHKQYDPPEKPRTDYSNPRPFALGKLDTAPLLNKAEPRLHTVEDIAPIHCEIADERKYAYKPGVAAEDLFRDVTNVREQARRNRMEHSIHHTAEDQMHSHLPVKPTASSSSAILGSDSLRTSGSTPRTDVTEYPWSEKGKVSTTMTSAAVTPARTSKRASMQVLHSATELPSMPKIDSLDMDWMRVELDRRFKVPDDRSQSTEKQPIDERLVRPERAGPSTLVSKVIAPPVSKLAATNAAQPSTPYHTAPQRTDSAQDGDMRAEMDYQQRQQAVPSSQHERSRPRERSIAHERKRSISREIREYFRPGSPQASIEIGATTSRPPSRARSFTQMVQEYIRPGSTTHSRKASADLGRTRDRQGSIATQRSEISDTSRSLASVVNQRKPWNAVHRFKHDRSDSDASLNGPVESPQQIVNLNRELPPLPSLDQWKEEDSYDDGSRDVFISWEQKTSAPAPRSILLPYSSPSRINSNKSAPDHHHSSSVDIAPSYSERVTEMNRQRAMGRPKYVTRADAPAKPATASRTAATAGAQLSESTTVHNPSPSVAAEEQHKRKWWKPQTSR